ncbi:hypothetical protein ACIPWF_20255 [Paenarthrobacter sp. NPDC089989]|uniref:hypothetical protein n=1 Tax=unclassified Paenarthrobacter TaxID=2634190 RepID=UPI00382D1522
MAKIKDQRQANAALRRKPTGETASTIALFVTILVVSVGLALWADLNIVIRGLIAIVAGIVAAGTTLALINRSQGGKNRTTDPVDE